MVDVSLKLRNILCFGKYHQIGVENARERKQQTQADHC